MSTIGVALLPAIIVVALMAFPVLLVFGIFVYINRREKLDRRRSPIGDKLLHQAGAQARQRVDTLDEQMTEQLMLVLLVGPTVMLAILLPRVNWAKLEFGWSDWFIAVGAVVWIGWQARKLVRIRRDRRKWREGMLAEIAAAQQLDQLQSEGCLVLHDIPADGFNLDHVVVGHSAVFLVETKSRRKPGKGTASANVAYDGKRLEFPGWQETRPLEQAKAQSRWLAEYLRGETGESIPVIPAVCLPGWFVTLSRESVGAEVKVINPKMRSMFVESGGRQKLDPAQRTRILTQLRKRYPDLPD